MKRFLLFALAVIMFAACSKDAINEQQNMQTIVDEAPETLVVGFEESDETRIQLNEAQKTVWTKGDLVSVFYRSDANQKWQYTGETGARTAELKRVDAGNATETMKRVVVVYPYNGNYYINTETYNVQASLPAVQNYLKDSYGTNGNIMISSSEYNQFSLKSVCGWLKLQLTGDGETIKSIKFRGNNGEQVAGELYINSTDATAALASDMGNADDNNAGGSLVFDDTILTEVTLDCGEGVALGKNATAFYIALPPQTFEQGFTVEIEDTEGYVMEQSTDKTLLIERNTIKPMAAFEFINPATPSAPAPASNEIWYTATAKVEPTFDDALVFGANAVSNIWDSETKRGIITFDGDVTMIGDDAFNNCDNLTGVTLPESVTSIGKEAFYHCDVLTEFTIPDGVTEIGKYAFCSCGKLANVAIGDSVTTIGDDAFAYCSSLTSVNIPDSVTTIGSNAFYGCDSLTSVTIGDSVTTIGVEAFASCDSLTEFMGKSAEDNGRILVVGGVLKAFAPAGIYEYTIPDSVTEIGDYAFYSCDSLTSITIGDSVTTIGDDAFAYCSSLTSVTIGDSVTTIGIRAFCECTSLTSVTIPDSVTTIGDYAFNSCDRLREFKGKVAEDNGRILVVDGVLKAFAHRCGATEYTIPNSVTAIGNSTFSECTSLTSVTIPDSVTTIGDYAFYSCDNLTSVTIGGSVTMIGGKAFNWCFSLTSVYCKAITPPELGDYYVFDGLGSDDKIYVPAESVSKYKNSFYTYWNKYASKIVGYDFEIGEVVE